MNRAAAITALLGAGLLAGAAACAPACAPAVHDAWIRSPPPGAGMLAGFARIANDCPAPLVVTGASSAAFADVSLHRTTTRDGVSRMRPVTELPVPAGATVVLEPGGLHLMLAGPTITLAEGDRVEVVFRLAGGGSLPATFVVR